MPPLPCLPTPICGAAQCRTPHSFLTLRWGVPFLRNWSTLGRAVPHERTPLQSTRPLPGHRNTTPGVPSSCVPGKIVCGSTSPASPPHPRGMASGGACLSTLVNSETLDGVLSAVRAFVPDLTSSKHKGQAGRVAVVGGCREYTGAPYFSAISALRLGADLSHVICSADAAPVIKAYSPELIVHPLLKESYNLQARGETERAEAVQSVVEEASYWVQRMDCIVVGPGLGRDPFMMECIAGIMQRARENNTPMVIDADGLFLVNRRLDLVQGYPLAVLTPNVVELKRLQQALEDAGVGSSGDPDADPVGALKDMAHRLGGVTLLHKGKADTITDGSTVLQVGVWGSPRRCGGQGDILAGSTAAMMAWASRQAKQGGAEGSRSSGLLGSNPGVLAACGASVVVRHAAASTFQAHRRSMVTGDMIGQLGDSFEALFPVGVWECEPRL